MHIRYVGDPTNLNWNIINVQHTTKISQALSLYLSSTHKISEEGENLVHFGRMLDINHLMYIMVLH